jgi:hypothetical protein
MTHLSDRSTGGDMQEAKPAELLPNTAAIIRRSGVYRPRMP